MLGNQTNKRILKSALDKGQVPHNMLFTGPPGCGKTTAARIVALGLNCEKVYDEGDRIVGKPSYPCLECSTCKSILNYNSIDIQEINVGRSGTKGDVDEIVSMLSSAPFSARVRVLIFDEAHKLTPASVALLLKIIEDGYAHVYFIFCTDQPESIKETAFHSRNKMTRLNFGRLPIELIKGLLVNVCDFEGIDYNIVVLSYIAEKADGAPRDALGWLKMISDEGSWSIDVAKEIVTGSSLDEDSPEIIDLTKALIKAEWTKSLSLMKSLKSHKEFNVELVRRSLAGYVTGCLKGAKTLGEAKKFSNALDTLNVPIFESNKKDSENRLYHYMFKTIEAIMGGVK